jgi:ferredoxin
MSVPLFPACWSQAARIDGDCFLFDEEDVMSWVSIDYDKCTNCGICVLRCERCFTQKKDTVTVQADENCCNLCGHCVSLCPTGAVVHHKMDMKNFPDIDEPITFHSTIYGATAKDNCVIASTTMGLLARTMDLETTYIGLFEIAARYDQPLIDELSLPKGNRVFSVLIAGYPKLRYLRTIDRRPIKTRWE